ncbi:MAG: carboxypeptidase-like regulatory domain-containing protein, partial [Bacteroidales bacterium]|nr:carboxypeptidase-like regulatory domain-containing protein [Bacteroidales bacterium]
MYYSHYKFFRGGDINAQTVRGTVKDVLTGGPLPYATVVIISPDSTINNNLVAITDTNGVFKINNVPPGRYSVEAKYVGYEPQRMVEVLVAGSKTTVLNFGLLELATQLEGVTI